MGFLRRLFGGPPAPLVAPVVPLSRDVDDEQLCTVTVGAVTIPAAIYQGYQRDVQDWSSGIRLEHPERGFMLVRDRDYPADFYAAGARGIGLAGIQHHPDGQRDEFAVGHFVQLRPDPRNPINPNAIAIWSLDGRYMAGYVPDDDLERIRGTDPQPVVGLVVWDHWTWRPRLRLGLRLLVGPTIRVALVDADAAPAERARRDAQHELAQATWAAQREAEWAAAKERKRLAAEARELARQERLGHRAEVEARKAQAAAWRAAGLCVDCGAPIEARPGRGRPAIHCPLHSGRP